MKLIPILPYISRIPGTLSLFRIEVPEKFPVVIGLGQDFAARGLQPVDLFWGEPKRCRQPRQVIRLRLVLEISEAYVHKVEFDVAAGTRLRRNLPRGATALPDLIDPPAEALLEDGHGLAVVPDNGDR